ncbi:MAG: carbon-nitrogen hydrolase family protein [Pleomorphochaeta sp.]
MKIAQIQMKVQKEKKDSLNLVKKIIKTQIPNDVDFIALPEMFNCPYSMENFPLYAEREMDTVWRECSNIAKEYNVYLSAGSVAELDKNNKVYNTAYVFDRSGKQIAKHRKMHLFDIDVKGGQYFKESETLSPGNKITTFETEFGTMGLCICYDFRFPELARLMTLKGAKVIFVPAAFNMTTGPSHWQVMFRSQALNNQVYAIGTAPSRDLDASYKSWGHSIVVDPWGAIVSQVDEKEHVIINDIDLNYVDEVRAQLPLLKHRRCDVYSLEQINK